MNTKIITLNAECLSGLQVKSLGYHHDHARALYFGLMKDMPFEHMKHFDETSKYCAVIEEYVPLKQ